MKFLLWNELGKKNSAMYNSTCEESDLTPLRTQPPALFSAGVCMHKGVNLCHTERVNALNCKTTNATHKILIVIRTCSESYQFCFHLPKLQQVMTEAKRHQAVTKSNFVLNAYVPVCTVIGATVACAKPCVDQRQPHCLCSLGGSRPFSA